MFTTVFLSFASIQSICVFNYYFYARRIEFLIYILYVVLISSFVSSHLIANIGGASIEINHQKIFIYGRGLLILSFGVYYIFGRLFTRAEKMDPKFSLQLEYVAVSLLTIGLFDIFTLALGSGYFVLDYYIRYVMFGIAMYSMFAIYKFYTLKNQLNTILVLGGFFLLLGSGISLIDMLYVSNKSSAPEEFIPFFILGVLAEFCCLLFGLLYKTNFLSQIKMEKLKSDLDNLHRSEEKLAHKMNRDLVSIRALVDISKQKNISKLRLQQNQNALLINVNEITAKLRIHSWSHKVEPFTVSDLIEFIKIDFGVDNCAPVNLNIVNKIIKVSASGLEDIMQGIYFILSRQINVSAVSILIEHTAVELQIVLRGIDLSRMPLHNFKELVERGVLTVSHNSVVIRIVNS